MSLINDMLRNLEQRHAAQAPLPNEVRPLPPERSGSRWGLIAAVAVVAVAAATVLLLSREQAPAAPAAAVTPPATPAAPAAPAPAPAAVVAEAPTLPPPVEAPPPAPAAPVATPTPAASAATPAPARRGAGGAPIETLRMATTLPSLERLNAKPEIASGATQQPPSPDTTPAIASAERSAVEADLRIRAESDVRNAKDLLAQGRRAEAEQALKQALTRQPSLTDAAMTLARLQVDRGDLPGAWETLSHSLPHAQNQAAYQAFCGTVLQRLNRSREAVAHYQTALRLSPTEGRWWVGLGIALEGAGRAAEAREAFQRARAAGNLPPEMAAFAEQKVR